MKKRSIRVAIVGSRDFPKLSKVRRYVRGLPKGTIVVSGGAPGVDRAAVREARRCGLRVKIFLPDLERWGRRSFAIRNRKIATYCDRLVAFHWNDSPGTAMTIGFAEALEKDVEIISR